ACGSACRSADRGIRKRKAGETSRGPAASAATDALLCSIARSSRSVVCRDRGVDGYLGQYRQSTLAPGTESAAHAVERLLRGDHSLNSGGLCHTEKSFAPIWKQLIAHRALTMGVI